MSQIGTQYLFTNQTTSANGTPFSIDWGNKLGVVKAWGTWNGANVTFQTLAPGTSGSPVWINVPDFSGNIITFSTNSQRSLIDLIQGEQLRAVLGNAGGSTSITVSIEMY